MSGVLFLKPGREKSVLHKHPWIFSGAIERVTGEPGVGETVEIRSSEGKFLARAAYSLTSQIRARIWSWVEAEEIDVDFLRHRLAAAIGSRERLLADPGTTALRLVHAESDGLPGLVVDRYGDVLVMQCLSTGADLWRNELAAILANLTGCRSVYERSDVDVRGLEGLPPRIGPLYGPDLDGPLEILENGLKFQVDVRTGHKTGFYLDQHRNRRRLQDFSGGKSVLNCFCYTGGFSVYALAGGAKSVVSVDSSAGALEMARENLRINGLDEARSWWEEADVFEYLRGQRDRAAKYDLIVLDPPKFAPTISHAEKAARAYKDINLLAFKLLKPGGHLFTFSCSGGVSADLFQKIVAGAALDAGVDAKIIDYMHQGEDHPVSLHFPEGAYLKGLICQVGE
jgi:23S rRNA (cytosine1962-C5)-methyltransferase